jgi:tetrahydromethanopterin S-methyltransferase subunit B
VDGSSVGVVSSYTFTNVQSAYTISATFALSPTIYGIVLTIVIVAIVAVLLILRKRIKRKS